MISRMQAALSWCPSVMTMQDNEDMKGRLA